MSFDTLRVYEAGRFHDVELPDWYSEACRISEHDMVDWHRTLDRELGCEHSLLTEEGLVSAGLEIRFWSSEMHGIFVVLETPLALVEQVVILNPADWLPFLSTYLAPLMATSAQSALIEGQRKIANALIARARHGEGTHVERETGLSHIDLNDDRNRRLAERKRTTSAQTEKGGVA